MIPDHLTGAELVNLGLLLMLAGIAGLALVVYAGEAAFRAASRAWARRQARRVRGPAGHALAVGCGGVRRPVLRAGPGGHPVQLGGGEVSDMQVAAISALGDKILIASIAACAGWFFAKFKSEKK